MRDISLKELLEAGCHFGHQTNRWNPKAAEFIYGGRDGVHIIDLAKTKEGLVAAATHLHDIAKKGGTVLFVGTKRQAAEVMRDSISKVRGDGENTNNFYYLLERWPGGLLTNFGEIKKNNLDEIVDLTERIAANKFVTKKEKLLASRKLEKYKKVYGGLVGLKELPSAVFFVDIRKEAGAIKEATSAGVTMLGISDTNTNPQTINFAIPANDDAVGSLKIILDYLTDAWMEGYSKMEKTVEPLATDTKE